MFRTSSFIFLTLLSGMAMAHQPRIVESNFETIQHPEVSQAFYGELKGEPAEFRIQSDQDFTLYVGLLLPDISNIQKDIFAEITHIQNGANETIALLDGSQFDWTPFFEEYAQDHYLWGPEYKADDSIKGETLKGRPVPAGDYRIKVYSPSNLGKYVLVTGFLEEFPIKEVMKTIITVPRLKAQFFDNPFTSLAASPYVWGYLLGLYALAFIAGFAYRLIVKKLARSSSRQAKHNIRWPDRLLRAAIAIGLFLWAVTTSWSPVLLFFSGFSLFEAIFSWCAFYAAIGKNSCPI